ncbi:sugar phosphate isomerase/epimerase family protein [Anaerosporobacter sp.]
MKISVFYDHVLQAAEQTGKSLSELLASVRKAGIEAVEINLTYLLEHDKTLELLKQADLAVSCIYEFYEMDRCDESKKVEKHIETAVKVGAGRILVVPGFLSSEESEEMQVHVHSYEQVADFFDNNEKVLHMSEGLTYAVTLGVKAGVTVTVEDFDDKKSPLSGMNGILWFLNHVPELRYTLDMGNFVYNDEDVLVAWEILKNKIAHVHCKDRGVEEDKANDDGKSSINRGLMSVAAGDGYLPIAVLVNRLKEFGYEGYLAIEHFDAPDQEMCMRRSAEFLRRTWECLCQS